jgi:hypothetical protein
MAKKLSKRSLLLWGCVFLAILFFFFGMVNLTEEFQTVPVVQGKTSTLTNPTTTTTTTVPVVASK